MAQFMLSPGVSIKEIDQSQYTSTSDASGNIVALIGYAEKGSFEPTYVYGVEDFNQKFGFTLADVPYLAQAVYKYFDDGKVLLVVRAGDDRDSDLYPTAAKNSKKVLLVSPSSAPATRGSQSFVQKAGLSQGAYSPSTTYNFKLLADNRAFKAPKHVEKWSAVLEETHNGLGLPSPAAEIQDAIVKIAYDNLGSTSFEINHKRDLSTGSTQEYYGAGTRTGTNHGNTINAIVYKYFQNDVYAEDATDFVMVSGSYSAGAIGTANLKAGFDWGTSNQTFRITIGSATYDVELATAAADAVEAAEVINAALANATNIDTSATVDISSIVEAQAVNVSQTNAKIILVMKTDTNSTGFILVGSGALAALGLVAGTYLPGDCVHGTWNAQTIESGSSTAWSGNFFFKKEATVDSAYSFQDTIDVSVTSPASGTWTQATIATAIQERLNIAYSAYNFKKARATCEFKSVKNPVTKLDENKIVITANGEATDKFASIVSISQGSSNDFVSLLGGTDAAVAGKVASAIGESKVTLQAKEKGSYGDKLALKVETQSVRLGATTNTYNNVYVLYNGKVVSSYYKVNWTNTSDSNYILTRMAGDKYINFGFDDDDEDTTLVKLPDGIYTLGDNNLPEGITADQVQVKSFVSGTNGWLESNGTISSMDADFIKALDKISNPEVYAFHIVAAPGGASSSVQNAIQDFCDGRRDCIGVVDAAPFGLGLGIANNIRSITEVNEACSTLNSSYVAAFWSWVLDTDADNNQYVWLPPSIYAIKAMVYTDSVAEPWYAPAGLTRGKVSAMDVEYSPREVERDVLYGDTAIVNPIVKFVNEGITIWGQKTAQRTLTATNRINVRRLLIYAEKLIAKMARGFLFEPHDEANWAAFARQANAILDPIRQRRGLYSFSVQCDSSTNTTALVDENLMAGKIYLKPMKTIEGITVDFTVQSTGAVSFNEA